MKRIDFLVEWLGTISVASYSWISLLSQILLHWQINASMQSVHDHFNDKLSPDKLAFIASSMDCKMNFQAALCYGIVGGLITAVAVFLVSIPFVRKERYPESAMEFRKYSRRFRQFQAIVYLASATYFLILITIFRLVDPHGLLPYTDVIYGTVIAGIIGASLLTACSYRRMIYQFRNVSIEKSYWKVAHSSAMQFFNTTVWVFMTMLIAFGAVAAIQGFIRMPPEISSSTQFGTVIVCWVLLTLIPVLGAGLGIVLPAWDKVKFIEDKFVELDFRDRQKTR